MTAEKKSQQDKAYYTDLLIHHSQLQTATMASHILPNNQKVWVRRADRHHGMWSYYLLGIVTKILGADALKPVPSLGGKNAIINESDTLKKLAQHDILAPRLLAQTEQALMMSHLSDEGDLMNALSKAKKANNNERLIELWRMGVQAIATVHKKKQHLSQCFARNMMVCSDDKIAFIDFEDNPAAVLDLSQCQIRDWLCYFHSTTFLLDDEQLLTTGVHIFKQALDTDSDNIIDNITKNVKSILWMRNLTHKNWRRDTLRLATFMRFVHHIKHTDNKKI